MEYRINADILDDLAKLPPAKGELVRNFRMNGSYKEVLFDQKFRDAAARRAAEKRIDEATFFAGEVFGEVTGRLLKIDGLEGNYAVIVPDIGGDQIKVLFDESIRKEIGPHYDHRVTAIGVLKYTEASPFPKSIRVQSGAICDRDPPEFRPSMLDLEGMFKGCYDNGLWSLPKQNTEGAVDGSRQLDSYPQSDGSIPSASTQFRSHAESVASLYGNSSTLPGMVTEKGELHDQRR